MRTLLTKELAAERKKAGKRQLTLAGPGGRKHLDEFLERLELRAVSEHSGQKSAS
jgi:hypothetical protein